MLKYVEKIDSLDSFSWSKSDHVQALYNYSQKGFWSENLDFLMLADELAHLEKTNKDLEVALLSIEKKIQEESDRLINMESQSVNNRDLSQKKLIDKLRERIQSAQNINSNRSDFRIGLESIRELENLDDKKKWELEKIKKNLTATKQKIFNCINDNVINVSGKDRSKWLETYSSNQSDINLECIKKFIQRINELVGARLREFINSKDNESQDIEIYEHVKPLSLDIINAHSAQENVQQQQQQSIRRNSIFFAEPEEKKADQQEEKKKSFD